HDARGHFVRGGKHIPAAHTRRHVRTGSAVGGNGEGVAVRRRRGEIVRAMERRKVAVAVSVLPTLVDEVLSANGEVHPVKEVASRVRRQLNPYPGIAAFDDGAVPPVPLDVAVRCAESIDGSAHFDADVRGAPARVALDGQTEEAVVPALADLESAV